jgi:hypothetical protein
MKANVWNQISGMKEHFTTLNEEVVGEFSFSRNEIKAH